VRLEGGKQVLAVGGAVTHGRAVVHREALHGAAPPSAAWDSGPSAREWEELNRGSWDRRARRQYGVESPSGSGRDTEVAGLVELGWAHWQFLETGSSGECARPDPKDEERKPATW
jgi:hypothetical protein